MNHVTMVGCCFCRRNFQLHLEPETIVTLIMQEVACFVVKIISVCSNFLQPNLFTFDIEKGTILAAQVWSGKVPGSATATINPTASRTHAKARTRMQTAWAQLQCFFSNNLPWGNAATLRDARRRVS